LNPVTLDILDCVKDTEALEEPGEIDVITGLFGGPGICTFIVFDSADEPSEFTASNPILYIIPGVSPLIVNGLVNPVTDAAVDQVLDQVTP